MQSYKKPVEGDNKKPVRESQRPVSLTQYIQQESFKLQRHVREATQHKGRVLPPSPQDKTKRLRSQSTDGKTHWKTTFEA